MSRGPARFFFAACRRTNQWKTVRLGVFLIVLFSLIAVCSWSPGLLAQEVSNQSQNEPSRPKNLLVLFSDDQRFDTIHALGNPEIRTPNLDRLARQGFVFTHAFIMGSMQGAVCVPSRAMFLSGRTLWHVPENLTGVPTWPQVFREHGFITFVTGKWHNGRESLSRSFDTGAAIFFGGMHDHFRMPVFDFDPTGKYPPARQKVVEKFSSELFADACIDFLKSYHGEKSFFAYVAFTAPHDPRTPPEPYRQMYDPADISQPPNFLPEHPFDNGELRVRDELLASFPRHPEDIRRHIAEYYAMITHLDAQIGRILETLRETGHLQDTLIVFASDNGLAVGRHGLMGKQNLYEHSQRVPLIFAGPGIPAGRSDALVYLFDVFPTVAEMFQVPPPEGVEGQSLLPIIRGEKQKVRDAVFGAYRMFQRSVRTERYKYITYHVKDEFHEQLFDIQNDPWETKNLANDSAYQGVKSQLKERLFQLQKELDDPVLNK
ncbi:sulfatase-like hydrolase/transferase [Thermogutta sp.]|uniref:sulfatase-like hydrolase/transferase n=1 Tax=Thermogutta sp. TaxID=1962930 RepID=UPI00321F9545